MDNARPESSQSESSRREFLAHSSLALAAATTLTATSSAYAAPSEKITLGWIGVGGQGKGLLKSFLTQEDVNVAAICDVDPAHSAQAVELVTKSGRPAPFVTQDMRRLLEKPEIDGVVVATPDHWHGPATILALKAGKNVYVEKPCAHNIREGRLMIETARAAKKIVQVGTQSRSSPVLSQAMERIKSGAIGDIVIAKAWNSQKRANIGHQQPGQAPADVDYDTWVGPAAFLPFQSNRFHYNWHWWFNFGTGDAGNDGVHELDIARWGLGEQTHPSFIAASGGKFVYDDDQQFPDTQYVVFEYPHAHGNNGPPRQLIYEHRIWSPYVQEGIENGNAFYGTTGYIILGKGKGWKMYGPKNKLIEEMDVSSAPSAGSVHHRNYLDSIRSGKLPNADIEIAHYSSALSHLANIATRVGERLAFDPQQETFTNSPAAQKLLGREYRAGHWGVPTQA